MSSPCLSPAAEPASLRDWLAVLAVSAGIFTFVTTEMLPVGILVPVAADLSVSEGTAGLMVTAPGVVAAVAALGVALAAGRLDRRLLLCGLVALLFAANVFCALAPNFAVMLAARVAVGLSIGGFWGMAGGLAVRLVPEGDVGRATSIIFAGIAAASVFGVPFGATIGDWAGWRMASGRSPGSRWSCFWRSRCCCRRCPRRKRSRRPRFRRCCAPAAPAPASSRPR